MDRSKRFEYSDDIISCLFGELLDCGFFLPEGPPTRLNFCEKEKYYGRY